ncbi:MAG TPA: tetratricopeptide repeat protein [Tepidisphaeraceae bacterium]|nr:tetratricopeptide repeat protein [Tepidisphaeraceae bacterium]
MAMTGGWRLIHWVAVVTVVCSTAIVRADDERQKPLPAGVVGALQAMVEAQQSGDLDKYAATLASPVEPVFRLHADSAIKVGEAKRNLHKAMVEKFGQRGGTDPFAYAFDEEQLKATLRRLVGIHIDQASPSGDNWKLQVTTTVRMPDGSTRTIPQGFIAVEYGADWKVQDLAIVGHLAAEKKGAETNWAIYRMFNTMADEVRAGKYTSWDQPITLAKAAYDKITGADVAPPAGHDEYMAGVKLYQAGNFAGSLAAFKQAAELGYPHAACMVAIQYSVGLGMKEDDPAAVEWFEKDIAKHDVTAENFLGSMMLEGDGAPKDPAEGMRLLKLAAEQDNDSAFLNIGRAYLFGLGVPKDPGTGMQWYARAAEMGNEQAAYFVKWLGQSPGNRSFKDEAQASAYQQIMLLRANALMAGQSGWRENGTWRAPDAQRARELNAQADQLALDNGLE